MKAISDALLAHLAGGVTTLAACWLIVRTDGAQFAFTTLDRDLTVDGTTFASAHGFSRSAITTGSTGEVDNLEVIGYFSSDGITETALINGLFDYASIYLFLVNWADLSQGILKLRRGWLGECVRNPDQTFHTELRGLTYALTQEFGNVFTPYCRADLGDAKCTIPIAPAPWAPSTAYAAGIYVSPLTKSTDALLQAIFLSGGGTSGATEPTWDTTVGDTTTDGSVAWTSAQPFRLVGTVATAIDQHSFVANALTLSGQSTSTTALISIRNNTAAGSALEISDGVNAPISVSWLFETKGGLAFDQIVTAINAAAGGTDIRIQSLSDLNITIVNTSGAQGDVTKTGDTTNPPALFIENFGSGWLDAGVLSWVTGNNAGTSMEIKTYVQSTGVVFTWLGLNFAPQPGDKFLYYPGCDKTRLTCSVKFANILNFRGEPDIPGLDAMLAYPDVS
jgi:hypothetical protein